MCVATIRVVIFGCDTQMLPPLFVVWSRVFLWKYFLKLAFETQPAVFLIFFLIYARCQPSLWPQASSRYVSYKKSYKCVFNQQQQQHKYIDTLQNRLQTKLQTGLSNVVKETSTKYYVAKQIYRSLPLLGYIGYRQIVYCCCWRCL